MSSSAPISQTNDAVHFAPFSLIPARANNETTITRKPPSQHDEMREISKNVVDRNSSSEESSLSFSLISQAYPALPLPSYRPLPRDNSSIASTRVNIKALTVSPSAKPSLGSSMASAPSSHILRPNIDMRDTLKDVAMDRNSLSEESSSSSSSMSQAYPTHFPSCLSLPRSDDSPATSARTDIKPSVISPSAASLEKSMPSAPSFHILRPSAFEIAYEALLKLISCPRHLGPLENAVTLFPCNHKLCEKCAIDVFGKMEENRCSQKNQSCSICSKIVIAYSSDYVVRGFVDQIFHLPKLLTSQFEKPANADKEPFNALMEMTICPIHLDTYNNDIISLFPCAHKVCLTCAKDIFGPMKEDSCSKHTSCPSCRTIVTAYFSDKPLEELVNKIISLPAQAMNTIAETSDAEYSSNHSVLNLSSSSMQSLTSSSLSAFTPQSQTVKMNDPLLINDYFSQQALSSETAYSSTAHSSSSFASSRPQISILSLFSVAFSNNRLSSRNLTVQGTSIALPEIGDVNTMNGIIRSMIDEGRILPHEIEPTLVAFRAKGLSVRIDIINNLRAYYKQWLSRQAARYYSSAQRSCSILASKQSSEGFRSFSSSRASSSSSSASSLPASSLSEASTSHASASSEVQRAQNNLRLCFQRLHSKTTPASTTSSSSSASSLPASALAQLGATTSSYSSAFVNNTLIPYMGLKRTPQKTLDQSSSHLLALKMQKLRDLLREGGILTKHFTNLHISKEGLTLSNGRVFQTVLFGNNNELRKKTQKLTNEIIDLYFYECKTENNLA